MNIKMIIGVVFFALILGIASGYIDVGNLINPGSVFRVGGTTGGGSSGGSCAWTGDHIKCTMNIVRAGTTDRGDATIHFENGVLNGVVPVDQCADFSGYSVNRGAGQTCEFYGPMYNNGVFTVTVDGTQYNNPTIEGTSTRIFVSGQLYMYPGDRNSGGIYLQLNSPIIPAITESQTSSSTIVLELYKSGSIPDEGTGGGLTGGVISEPNKPTNIGSVLIGLFQGLFDWLNSIFNPAALIGSGQTASQGDTFQKTFTLENSKAYSLPDTVYTDGSRSWVYKAYAIYDPQGNILKNETVEVVNPINPSESVSITSTYEIPSGAYSGKYGVVATLVEIRKTCPSTGCSNANDWVQGEPVVIDKEAVNFNVQGIAAPTAPTGNFIGGIFDFLKDLFNSLFGWLQ